VWDNGGTGQGMALGKRDGPSGAKALCFVNPNGTAKAVPFPNLSRPVEVEVEIETSLIGVSAGESCLDLRHLNNRGQTTSG
jgi:hypothetical protein